MPPRNRRAIKKEPEPDALYSVFRKDNDKPAYLPAKDSKGVTKEEAERLSKSLVLDTYIKKVWERPADE